MKTRYIILSGFILMLVLMALKLYTNKEKFALTDEEKKSDNTRYVEVVKVKNDSTLVYIEGQGRIASSRKVDISAEVQGMLLPGRILRPGISVRQGELLFQVKDTDARLALQARKSAYLNVIANILPDLRLDYADNYNNWKNFFDNIDITKPLPELPEAKSSKEKTFIATKNIFGEYYGIKADEERLRKYAIVAPFDGTITEVTAEPGAVVNPGSRLLGLMKSDELEVEIPIDVKNIGWIKMGATVSLKATSGPATYTGKIIRIGEYVNATTQSIPVFVKIDKKPGDVLYNNMYLTARIEGGYKTESFEVPRRSVFDENYYFVVEDSHLVKKQLHIEFVTKESVIASGIQNNALYVVEPVTAIDDSVKIAPMLKK